MGVAALTLKAYQGPPFWRGRALYGPMLGPVLSLRGHLQRGDGTSASAAFDRFIGRLKPSVWIKLFTPFVRYVDYALVRSLIDEMPDGTVSKLHTRLSAIRYMVIFSWHQPAAQL